MTDALQDSIDTFITSLAGKKLTGQQAQEIATALHAATVDTPEMLWVNVNFEAVADEFYNATKCAADDSSEYADAFDGWFRGSSVHSLSIRKGGAA